MVTDCKEGTKTIKPELGHITLDELPLHDLSFLSRRSISCNGVEEKEGKQGLVTGQFGQI